MEDQNKRMIQAERGNKKVDPGFFKEYSHYDMVTKTMAEKGNIQVENPDFPATANLPAEDSPGPGKISKNS